MRIDGFPFSESNPDRSTDESSQEDCLPFTLDDDSSGPDGSPSRVRRSPLRSTYGFSVDKRNDRREVLNAPNKQDIFSQHKSGGHRVEISGFRYSNRRPSEGSLKESLQSVAHAAVNVRSKGTHISSSFLHPSFYLLHIHHVVAKVVQLLSYFPTQL